MNLPVSKKAHILFLFSDTGAGHRSGAQAIIEALELEFPGQFSTEMVDAFKDYAPPPLNRTTDFFPTLIKLPDLWRLGYRVLDDRRRFRYLNNMVYPYVRHALQKMLREQPADLIVSVHPLTNQPVLRQLGKSNTPFVTVVLDMVAPVAWYDSRADLIIVPTQTSFDRGLKLGVSPRHMRVVGMPIAARFNQPCDNRLAIRKRLGWQAELPIVLIVGGGDGLGPIEKIAKGIACKFPHAMLVVVCGHNQVLFESLNKHSWEIPVQIHGFVQEMSDFMCAADILITKAGPGTISEAFCAGLPMILYHRVPGQEDGNIPYVINAEAGIWAPKPDRAIRAALRWIEFPEIRNRYAESSRCMARPQAARDIARLLVSQIEKGTTRSL
jgi:1,2-diacylglycerol 3-beta-galactosyltransferase